MDYIIHVDDQLDPRVQAGMSRVYGYTGFDNNGNPQSSAEFVVAVLKNIMKESVLASETKDALNSIHIEPIELSGGKP